MRYSYAPLLPFIVAIVAVLAAGANRADAEVLFSDSFDRSDNRNIDADLSGIVNNTGTTLDVDGVYTHPFVDPANETTGQDDGPANGGGAQILGNSLQLAVGPGTSNAYVNHNFTNASILSDGAFRVSLDVLDGYGGAGTGQGGAFAIGMSQSDADLAGDAFQGGPNDVKMTNAFPSDFMDTVSDFWVGLRGNGTLAWGNGAVATTDPNYNTANVGAKFGTISANFGVSDFNAGSSVNYEVLFNGDSVGVGSFSWSESNTNYIGIDARDGSGVNLDNLTVETSAAPLVPSLTIDRNTGNITLTNETSQPLSIVTYSMTSQSGGFDTTAWSTIESQGIDTNNEWVPLTDTDNAISGDLSEGTLGEYTMGASGTATDSIDLGNAWIQSPLEDVALELRDADENDVPLLVRYVGDPIQVGDFDGNGVVDAADWPTVRDNLISDVSNLTPVEIYLSGDLSGDGLVNQTDFREFKALYEAAQGVGSFAKLLNGTRVPEPASISIAALAAAALMSVRRLRGSASAAALLGCSLCFIGAGDALAVNLFTDTFDRADNTNIDAETTGITGTVGSTLPADGVYNEPHVDAGGRDITSNELRLAVGPGTSNVYVDHNFTDAAISSDGGFRITLDVNAYDQTAVNFGGAFALGMTQAEADSASDAFNGNPSQAKFTNAFEADFTEAISDFWVGLRGNGTMAWAAGPVPVADAGFHTANVGSKTGTISATFAPAGFAAGNTVAYEVFYNGASQGFGSFAWTDDMSNYIGVDARDSSAVQLDNFTIESVTDAAVHPLRLRVDTATGVVSLAGGDSDNMLDFYEVQSPGMGLVDANFSGLEGATGFEGWERNGVIGPASLSESLLGATGTESTTMSAGAAGVSLGSIYDTSLDTRDLQLVYYDVDGNAFQGFVEYVSGSLPDFNGDGMVDLIDYTVWRDNLGATGSSLSQGDADGDGDVTAADYLQWKANFGATAAGAQSSTTGTAVPEPSALIVACLGVAALLVRGNRQRGKFVGRTLTK